MRKLFNEFCRKENVQTWAPMLSSFFGIFCSPLIGRAFDQFPIAFWIAFAVSAICGTLFVAFSVRYLRKWHSIITLLRNGNNDNLLKIATYIAMTEDIKEWNSDFTLSKVDVSYDAEAPRDSQTKKCELHVQYKIEGTVRRKMSATHFYMLAKKTTSENPTVSYRFDGDAEESRANKAEERAGVTHYVLTGHKDYKPNDIIRYTISIRFPAERGLSTHTSQRFLFDPRNFSVDCPNATVVFHATLPENVFGIPRVDVFTDGLNRNKDSGPYSLCAESTQKQKNGCTYKVYRSNSLDVRTDRLYAVMFSPEK